MRADLARHQFCSHTTAWVMESDDQATAVTWATMRYFTASSVHLLSARVYTAAAVQVAFCKGHAGFWVSSKQVLDFVHKN